MKENKQPLLSICIPTYNRWHLISQVIESIINEKMFQNWNIEIVISDNDSNDNTFQIVSNYKNKFKNIKYHKNNKNIWGMPNINLAYSLWKWDYIRCISSHMMVCSGALDTIETILIEKSPELLVNLVASRSWKYDKYSILDRWNYNKELGYIVFNDNVDYFNYIWDQVEYDKSSFYVLNNLFSNISCFIFNRKKYDENKSYIISNKWSIFFNKYNFIHCLCAYCKNQNNVAVNLNKVVEPTIIGESDLEKEKKTLRNRWDSQYMKDAHYLWRYILDAYKCWEFFKAFIKKYNNFRTKLFIISNIPLINWIKWIIPFWVQEKIWHFINTFKVK